jgi:hypothetical protein
MGTIKHFRFLGFEQGFEQAISSKMPRQDLQCSQMTPSIYAGLDPTIFMLMQKTLQESEDSAESAEAPALLSQAANDAKVSNSAKPVDTCAVRFPSLRLIAK